MSNNEQNTETLIRYLDGELTGANLEAFEQALANNEPMRMELENLSVAKLAIQHYGLKSQVAGVHTEMMAEINTDEAKPRTAKIYPFVRSTMRFAAAILVLFLLFGAYEVVTISSPQLSAEKNIPYDLGIQRGAAATTGIEQAYADHNFNKVIHELQANNQPTTKDHFLGGMAFLSTLQADQAIGQFNQVLAPGAKTNDFKEDAEYYLAVSYLANNQPVQAKTWFTKIYQDKEHLYHSKVTYWTILKLKLLLLKNPGR